MPATRIVEPDEGPRSKRAAILSAAIKSFGKNGYDATKWSAVADQVGIGQTALYHYFESKAHCLLTIMRMELQRSHEMFVKATAGETDPMAALRAAVRAAYDVSGHDVLRMRILENNVDLLANRRASAREETERAAARELVQQIETSWTELVQRGMDAGVFVRRDARTLALSMLGMIVSVWRWYRPRGTTPLAEVRDLIEDACVRVVRP
ncbi:TetR/AcrR family transcriptional regulator [Phytohabitans rumicis]|uniref:TetR family transcriptional regulator n=1 Tax=Phytohabitans rumicis TaxID=1076125 RepID=A0A6V8KXB5_9ACTN|nr:TetR/AcrR family transcriptional regulator [Phytohabitans rumicis]GFJ86477.1 TetR family transcriptional regulator [Phytohabitans rumicis]